MATALATEKMMTRGRGLAIIGQRPAVASLMNIEILRRKIVSGHYELTEHAKDEAADDEFDAADIEQIVLTGRIAKVLTKDKRGTRYVVAGLSHDKKNGEVVCRILPSGKMRIITVYST